MKLYIVRAYSDEHKMHSDARLVGIFTNTTKLLRAVREHADELGLCDFRAWAYHFTHTDAGHSYSPNSFLYTGHIEQVDANTYFEEDELS